MSGKGKQRDRYRGYPVLGNRILVAQTCNTCGEILGAKHYWFNPKTNYWTYICNGCIGKSRRASAGKERVVAETHAYAMEQYNQTLEKAVNNGNSWTLKEVDLIVELRAQGMHNRDIAIRFGRTYFSINSAVVRYGLTDGWPTRELWVIRLGGVDEITGQADR